MSKSNKKYVEPLTKLKCPVNGNHYNNKVLSRKFILRASKVKIRLKSKVSEEQSS